MAAVVLVVLLVVGVVGVLGVRYVTGLVGQASGGFSDGSGEVVGEADVPVERMDLTATVAATGSLTAGRPVTLGFTGSGEVTTVEVAVGDRVVPGQVLARLDPRLAQLDLDAAEAALSAAERAAGASSSAGGAGAEAARQAEARVSVSSARTALARTRDVAAANAAALDSAVAAATRQRDRDTAAAAEADALAVATQAAEVTPAARQAAQAELTAASAAEIAALEALGTAPDDPQAQAALSVAVARKENAQRLITDADATVAATQAARSEAAAAQAAASTSAEAVVTAVDSRRAGLASDAQTVDSAASQLAQAEAALQVLLTGGTEVADGGGPGPEELQVAVDRARLEVETARTALDGTTIVAPVAATVTAVDLTTGTAVGSGAATPASSASSASSDEGATPASGTITLTATQALVAEVSVPETDAVRVEPGMPAELKFSALPDVIGTGRVLTVVAAESDASRGEQGFDPFTGQATPAQKSYTVTITVDELPQGARAGLSIAARITTGAAPRTLVVPTAAVLQADGKTMVRVVDGEDVAEVEVDLGLRQGGFSQVVDGLEEGDVVRVGDPTMMSGPEGFDGGP